MTTGIKVLLVILALGLVGGAIYLFSKSSTTSKDNAQVATTTASTSNTGLSGLLAGLNLSGLKIF